MKQFIQQIVFTLIALIYQDHSYHQHMLYCDAHVLSVGRKEILIYTWYIYDWYCDHEQTIIKK